MKNIANSYISDEETVLVPFYAQSVAPADEAVMTSSKEEEEYYSLFDAVASSFRAFAKAPTLERARGCMEDYSMLSDIAKEVYGVRSAASVVLSVLSDEARAKYDEYLAELFGKNGD